MMKFLCVIFSVSVLISAEFVQAAKSRCDFSKNAVEESTGTMVIQTDWDALVTIVMGGESEAYGSVSVISRDGEKYLAVQLKAMDFYPLPEQFASLEDPTWDPAHRDFLDDLLGDSVIFPAGSSLRLDLDDQSSIVLNRTNHLRVRADYANPGQSPRTNSTEQKVAKKLMGFLAKKSFGADEVTEETSPHYTVTSNVILKYPIDSESEAILNKADVTSMRIESRDRYYTLGWRSTMDKVFSWNKNSYPKVRDALQCVNTEIGKGQS